MYVFFIYRYTYYVIYISKDSILFVIYLFRVLVYKEEKGGKIWGRGYRRYTPYIIIINIIEV